MASIKSIMNVDDDQSEPQVNKRDHDPTSNPRIPMPPHTSNMSSQSSSSNSAASHPRHSLHPSSHQHYHHPQPHHPLYLDNRYPHPSHGHGHDRRTTPLAQHPSPSSPENFSPASSSSLVSSSHQQATSNPGYRGSNTPDPMDQHGYSYGYHGASSSSSSLPPPPPQLSVHSSSSSSTANAAGSSPKPFTNNAGGNPQIPVKYTPVTHRVSKALKGLPVHICNDCVPPRVSQKRAPWQFGFLP